MPRGINKVILIGNTGDAPSTRYVNNIKIANLSLATSETWKDKQTGAPQERTEWHRLVFFGRLAEICQEYVGKGNKLYIEGHLQTKRYQDQSGNDRYTTQVVVDSFLILDGIKDKPAQPADAPASAPPPAAAQAHGPAFDDDIPF